jgi:hypothetical protein
MDSVASNRLEQYPQLNPYRLPANRGTATERGIMTLVPAAATAGAPAPAVSVPSLTGTRSVVRQTGQRNVCPACPSSAESDARQMWHGKTIMTP